MRHFDHNDDPGSGLDPMEPEEIPPHVHRAAAEDLHRRKKAEADGRRHNLPVDRNGKRRRPTDEQKSSMFQTERGSWWVAAPRTPCEAAWRVPSYVTLLKEYAQTGEGILEFPVTMPDGTPVIAKFHSEVRLIAGLPTRVIYDPATRTVYTGHGIQPKR